MDQSDRGRDLWHQQVIWNFAIAQKYRREKWGTPGQRVILDNAQERPDLDAHSPGDNAIQDWMNVSDSSLKVPKFLIDLFRGGKIGIGVLIDETHKAIAAQSRP